MALVGVREVGAAPLPARALAAPARQLEPEDPALAGRRDPDRDERRHGHDLALLAGLEARGVEPEVRERGVRERPAAEPLDLRVEGRARPADLAPADALDPQRPDQVVDPAGADARHARLPGDREQGPLGAAARIEQGREARAVAHARHRQVDRPHPRVPAPLAVPVAVVPPRLGVADAPRHGRQPGGLGLHQGPGERPDALAEEVGVALGDRLRTVTSTAILSSAIVGAPPWVSQVQRRDDDAGAAFPSRRARCYTYSRDVTACGSRPDGCQGRRTWSRLHARGVANGAGTGYRLLARNRAGNDAILLGQRPGLVPLKAATAGTSRIGSWEIGNSEAGSWMSRTA